jgi:transposase
VDRSEAEAIYDAGREVVVEVLLAMDRRIRQLEAREARAPAGQELAQLLAAAELRDPPGAPRLQRGEDRSGRKRGGQPGHEGRGRDLLTACAVDEVIEHWPARRGCGYVFSEDERRQVG